MHIDDSIRKNISSLVPAVYSRGRECWHTVGQDCSIASLQQHAQLPPQVPHRLVLLLPRLAGQCRPQPLHLSHCRLVPSTKRFHHDWQKGDTLLLASISRSTHLPGIGVVEGVPSCGSRPYHRGSLARVDHGHVQGSILSRDPVRKEDIGRAAILPWDEEPDLSNRSQPCCHCSVVEMIP